MARFLLSLLLIVNCFTCPIRCLAAGCGSSLTATAVEADGLDHDRPQSSKGNGAANPHPSCRCCQPVSLADSPGCISAEQATSAASDSRMGEASQHWQACDDSLPGDCSCSCAQCFCDGAILVSADSVDLGEKLPANFVSNFEYDWKRRTTSVPVQDWATANQKFAQFLAHPTGRSARIVLHSWQI